MYEIAWNVKKLIPTGSAMLISGNGASSDTLASVSLTLVTKNP